MKEPKYWIARLFVLLAIFLLLLAMNTVRKWIRFRIFGIPLTGSVVSFVSRGRDRYQVPLLSLEILVEVDGKEYRFPTNLHWNAPPYRIGDSVPVRMVRVSQNELTFMWDHLEEYVTDGFFALVIGLVLLVMGIGFW
ncbi:hypothetical protein EHQ92_05695 [Leptospira biflexa]|jgi:hypothetical protein|uniref:hypothetical protein n=1 Tax=Leptospira biflexa TaxID=172 RepID=UPI001083D36D|nr:hypothetical protein [Leptospira biflexa]TGM37876.1 hypothetical protein EHQ80_09880 [Leptospira biflexa]TGM41207.1 hypothetical protein EHQ89_04445 [Leptospira biflexa]TGM47410.1 hypothetical protein EHQ92_05695 [Leptospira biflexa]TGM50125.1 hypothetical protein EHQ88_07390 [Leptospira biflexa]